MKILGILKKTGCLHQFLAQRVEQAKRNAILEATRHGYAHLIEKTDIFVENR